MKKHSILFVALLIVLFLGMAARSVNSRSFTYEGDVHPEVDRGGVVPFALTRLPSILLIDDDYSYDLGDLYPPDVAGRFHQVLTDTASGLGFEDYLWDVMEQGIPLLDFVDTFDIVIWTTGLDSVSPLVAQEEDLLESYLIGGGTLWLSSQDYLSDGVTDFARIYLHVDSVTPNLGVDSLCGDWFELKLSFPGHPEWSRTDGVEPADDAVGRLQACQTDSIVMIFYQSPEYGYKAYFSGFVFEAVVNGPYPNNRRTFLRRFLTRMGYPPVYLYMSPPEDPPVVDGLGGSTLDFTGVLTNPTNRNWRDLTGWVTIQMDTLVIDSMLVDLSVNSKDSALIPISMPIPPGVVADSGVCSMKIGYEPTHDVIDMGEFWFLIVHPVSISLALEDSVVVPGDTLFSRVEIANNTDEDRTVVVWLDLILPSGKPFPQNPVDGPFTKDLVGSEVAEVIRRYAIPDSIPLGVYSLEACVGNTADQPMDVDIRQFNVEGVE